MAAEIIFWGLAGLMVYSYAVYPFGMAVAGSLLSGSKHDFFEDSEPPFVSILMSVHNEESVIEKKVRAIFSSEYPGSRFEFIVGSDASNDNTNDLLLKLGKEFPGLQISFFSERRGKPAVINELSVLARGDIIVITDADVMPQPDTLARITAPFADGKVGLVESTPLFSGSKKGKTNLHEMTYQYIETKLKENESRVTGYIMGPSGGFYAIRKELYCNVPENFLVDDFYICMNVLTRGYKTLSPGNACVEIPINDDLMTEFSRKIRIASGNFQNLAFFRRLLLTPWRKLSLMFISHKVIRWTGPVIYILALVMNLLLVEGSVFYLSLFLVQLIFILLSALDILLQKLKFNLVPIRFITHFYLMNLAMLRGFFIYLRGIRTGTWEPTKRVD